MITVKGDPDPEVDSTYSCVIDQIVNQRGKNVNKYLTTDVNGYDQIARKNKPKTQKTREKLQSRCIRVYFS